MRYYPPSEVTVQMFKDLPKQGYGLIILRAHTIPLNIIGQDTERLGLGTHKSGPILADVGVMTSEPYSGSSHVYELLANELVRGSIGKTYFAITPAFVRNEMQGTFPNSTIILMGCAGVSGQNNGLARALLDRGAGSFVGWDNTVSADRTDAATSVLLQSLTEGNTVQAAVSSAMLGVGSDPEFGSHLRALDLKAFPNEQVVADPTPGLLAVMALVAASPICFLGVVILLTSKLPRIRGRGA